MAWVEDTLLDRGGMMTGGLVKVMTGDIPARTTIGSLRVRSSLRMTMAGTGMTMIDMMKEIPAPANHGTRTISVGPRSGISQATRWGKRTGVIASPLITKGTGITTMGRPGANLRQGMPTVIHAD